MTIKLKLKGQELIANAPELAEHAVNTLFCSVDADSDWDGLAIRLVFRTLTATGITARKAVVTDRSKVEVPAECLRHGYLFINAIGVCGDGKKRLTTGNMDVGLRIRGVAAMDAPTAEPIMPNEYEQLLSLIGDLSSIGYTDITSAAEAMQLMLVQIGTVSTLDTEMKENLVGAVNELLMKLGDVKALQAEEKSSIVAAVNELLTKLGDVKALQTEEKSSIVAAVNELLMKLGDVKALQTAEKSSIVAAVNELAARLDFPLSRAFLEVLISIADGDICGAPYIDNNADPNEPGILAIHRTADEEKNPGFIEVPSVGMVHDMIGEGEASLPVVDGTVCTRVGQMRPGGSNALGLAWHQVEPSERIGEPYLNEWGWQCCLKESSVENHYQPMELYRWLYRCMEESFAVTDRTIVVTGADGVERTYFCQTDAGALSTVYPAEDAGARILRIPLVQFPGLTEDALRHILMRVMLDNAQLCYPLWPRSDALPVEWYEGNLYGLGDGGALCVTSVCPTLEERVRMRTVLHDAAQAVQSKAMELYGFCEGQKLTRTQKLQVAKIIHDYIIITAHPQADKESTAENAYWFSNLEAAVFDGNMKALCAGYTKAFNFLARRYGIEAIYMSGMAYMDTDGAEGYEIEGGHAWIALRLSDEVYGSYPGDPSKWALMDVYWDEPAHERQIGGDPEREDILWKYFLDRTTVMPSSGDAQYAQAYRVTTTDSGYGHYPMWGEPSVSCPYEGNTIYKWEELT